MPRHVTITTPENVRIEYELAGPASRAAAAILDLCLQALVIVIVSWGGGRLFAQRPAASAWMTALMGIAGFVVLWGYYTFFETLWNGRTPGKRMAGLRTVRQGGLPVDLSSAAIRNLVRVIDFLPILYLIGGIAMMVTSRSQRLGDLAAGTIVIKERVAPVSEAAATAPAEEVRAPEAAYVGNVELVTPDEFEAMKRFVERAPELSESVRESIAARLAEPLMLRLGIAQDPRIVYSRLLAEIYAECVRSRGMR